MTIADLYKAIEAICQRIQKYNDPNEAKKLKDSTYKTELKFITEILKSAGVEAENGKKPIDEKNVLGYFINLKKTEFYHYTDLNGLLGIFSDYIKGDSITVNSCCMRASHIRFLNDSQEYVEGRSKYSNYLKKFNELIENYSEKKKRDEYKKEIPEQLREFFNDNDEESLSRAMSSDTSDIGEDIYSISFCGNGDLLSQWKYYGRNSGIAIKFKFDKAKFFIGNELKDIDFAKAPNVSPLKIAYTELEKLILFAMSAMTPDIADGGIHKDQLLRHNPQADIFIPFCKNRSFKEECESRLVFTRPDNVKCEYTVSEGRIKPYIPITLMTTNDSNVIESITVGPGENQNLVYNALIHIFDSKKFCFQEDDGQRGERTQDIEKEKGETYCEDCKYKPVLNSYPYRCSSGIEIKKSAIPFRG